MDILITAGSTTMMVDKVRMISNIFKGRTGHEIAKEFSEKHTVTLLTSNKNHELENGTVVYYKTFDELYTTMETLIKENTYSCIIHSAAVSDYTVEGVYEEEDHYGLDDDGCYGHTHTDLRKIDSSKKISSGRELFLKMIPTKKIVDEIREWGFGGTLVKFKLQVDISDDELLEIAHDSMKHSNADIIVANCLEWSSERAYILSDKYKVNTKRDNLPKELLSTIDDVRRDEYITRD